ncbi:MAG TPA: SDR family oxidoreductase, partial [Vicinamibacteria bacterium]|nr:SDR family oxidoreductase [Vicinamibacteria bacterium]
VSIEAAIDAARPDAVVHLAAAADADRCEADPALAEALNVRAPELLARACARRGIGLVAISTDLVLTGDRAFSTEEDPVRPALVYGRTKHAGERAVLTSHPGAAVVRVALVSGRGHGPRGTATEAIAWALRAGRPLRLFTDQFRTPVDCDSVADGVIRLVLQGGSGLFHFGGPERLSRYELGLRVARRLGLPSAGIEAVQQGEGAAGLPRPADASLDSTRAERELGWRARSLDDSIASGRPEPARL